MEAPIHRHSRHVVFGDVDMAGWMHFPRIFDYFEDAEHEWMRLQGLPIIDAVEGGWPRARVECDYKSPLRFGDEIDVLLGIERVGSSSVTWIFEVWKGGECAASGRVVAVRVDPTGRPLVMDVETRRKFGV
jgi:acyl-CoA thioesterase FadM